MRTGSVQNRAIKFENGTYRIDQFERLSPGERLGSVSLIGDDWRKTRIITNYLDFRQIKDVKFDSVSIEGKSDHKHDFLVFLGIDSTSKIDSIHIHKTIFKNSGKALLSIVGAKKLNVLTSHFGNAGYANEKMPNRPHYFGNAIGIANLESGSIVNTYFTAIRRAGVMALGNVNNLTLAKNTFSLRSYGAPNPLTGYKGAACFYQTSEKNTGIVFENNQCFDYFNNGVRVTGTDMIVKNNHFNHRRTQNVNANEDCTSNNYASIPGGPAIKTNYSDEFIPNNAISGSGAFIKNNCMFNSSFGVWVWPLERGDDPVTVDGLTIDSNTIMNANEYGLFLDGRNNGYCNIHTSNNVILNSRKKNFQEYRGDKYCK